MSQAILCRLCVTSCTQFKSLIDVEGQNSAAYDITVKYFDPMLLTPGIENTSTVICIQCWTYIRDFNQFKQNVIISQAKIQNLEKQLETHHQEHKNSMDISGYTIVEINNEMINNNSKPETCPCENCCNESKCTVCYATFSSPYLLREHFQIEHPNKNFNEDMRCQLSEQTIDRDDTIAKFKTVLVCEICEETFSYYSLLQQHFKLDHPEEKCYVICCKHKYLNTSELLDHIGIHLNPKTHQCHICNLILTAKYSLKRHLEKVHGEKSNLNCNQCNMGFKKFSNLNKHKRFVHNDTDLNIGNTFTVLNEKRKDSHRINPTTKYIKEILNETPTNKLQSYSQTNEILSVKRRVQEYDAFIAKFLGYLLCAECKESFKNFALLSQHYSEKHPDKKCHNVCCNRKLNNRFSIVSHIRRIHLIGDKRKAQIKKRDSNKCHICGMIFTSNHSLRRHISKSHSTSTTAKNQIQKLASKQNKPFNRSYKNNIVCHICKMIFTRKDNLTRHIFQKHSVDEIEENSKLVLQQENTKFQEIQIEAQTYEIGYINTNDCETIAQTQAETPTRDISVNKNACHICKMIFTRKDNLKRHIFRKHTGKTSITQREQRFKNQNYSDRIGYNFKLDLPPESEEKFEKVHTEEEICYEEVYQNNNQIEISFSSSLIVQNQLQKPPIDIVDIKQNISFNSDNECATSSDIDTFPLNRNLSNESDSVFKPSTKNVKERSLEYDDFIAKWKGDLECPLCKNVYANYAMLNEHFHEEHPNNKSFIICCQRKLINRFHVAEHLKLHINPKAFQCDICGRCCFGGFSLERHKRLVHAGKNKTLHRACACEGKKQKLDETLNTNNNTTKTSYNDDRNEICCERKENVLEADAIIAKWKNQLECSLCSATFPYFSLLRDHFYCEHRPEKCIIQCCQRKMLRMRDIVDHIRNKHLQHYSYKCNICKKQFSANFNLTKHMKRFHNDNGGSV